MNRNELNKWRNKLYLNFVGIKEAKEYCGKMIARYQSISDQVDELLAESKEKFKGELKPIYLHRSSDSAARGLKWKLSSAKCFGFGAAAKTYSLLSKDVLMILKSNETVDDALIIQVVDMDFKRCYLNYALNYSFHEMTRVKLFIDEFESWRKLPKCLKSLDQ
jgi:hypothetical protein